MSLTYERARERLRYDPETGALTWAVDFMKCRAGQEAGGSLMKGYKRCKIDYIAYPHHRLAWLLMTGEWPDQLDHINGVRTDNRWANLRKATPSQNLANRPAFGRAGLPKGVYRHHAGRFGAQAWLNGQRYHLGIYDTADQAHAAYLEAATRFHGEFARS